MATLYQSKVSQNQGQAFVPGWNNQSLLKNVTAYIGTDGNPFLPVDDRDYTPGRTLRLTNGGTTDEGFPIVRFVSPVITDGQIDYLVNTLGSGQSSFKVTVRYHRYDSVGNADTFVANAWLNLNLDQLKQLTRKQYTYNNFVWEYVIVQTL